jgi:hypothetical protein
VKVYLVAPDRRTHPPGWRRWRRRAGLKIQKAPILSGHLSLKTDRVFHRKNGLFGDNLGAFRGTASERPKVEHTGSTRARTHARGVGLVGSRNAV